MTIKDCWLFSLFLEKNYAFILKCKFSALDRSMILCQFFPCIPFSSIFPPFYYFSFFRYLFLVFFFPKSELAKAPEYINCFCYLIEKQ